MTTGALIFAFNNEQIDYLGIAAWSAANIRRHLGIPVTAVTDSDIVPDAFDHVIQCNRPQGGIRHFLDAGTVTWYNYDRSTAFELSPYDQTLVLDADYVVASDNLKSVLSSPKNFLSFRRAYDVTGQNDFSGLDYFGQHQMPMWWATAMMFRRSNDAELIFSCMSMIQKHWDHYKNIYKITKSTYRNDHALSIALSMVNGHWIDHDSIPWGLPTLMPEHIVKQVQKDQYRVEFVNQENHNKWLLLCQQDFHAMGKKHLGEIVASNT